MENKLSFDEVELNYILDAVRLMVEHNSCSNDPHKIIIATELENIQKRISCFLDG